MKKVLIGFCCTMLFCLTGLSLAAEKDDIVMAKETGMWDLIKKGDYETFASHLTDKLIEVAPDGKVNVGKAALMEDVKKLRSNLSHCRTRKWNGSMKMQP